MSFFKKKIQKENPKKAQTKQKLIEKKT